MKYFKFGYFQPLLHRITSLHNFSYDDRKYRLLSTVENTLKLRIPSEFLRNVLVTEIGENNPFRRKLHSVCGHAIVGRNIAIRDTSTMFYQRNGAVVQVLTAPR